MAKRKISRKQAKAWGRERYFTGTRCRRGHLSERYTVGGHCIACMKITQVDWTSEHPGRQKEIHADWYQRNREDKLAKNRAYAKANPDVMRAAIDRYIERNLEKVKESSRRSSQRWYSDENNRRLHFNRRRTREKNIPGSHTRVQIAELLIKQKYRCVYCNADLRKVKRHLDHIFPMTHKKASNSIKNLQWLCQRCNTRKRDKSHYEFSRELKKETRL